MALTTNFGWNKPTVGGDDGTWGTELNATIDAVDADLQAVKASADAVSGGKAVRTTAQSIPDVTYTTIEWESEEYDDIEGFDLVTSPTRFTVPVGQDGLYLVQAGTSWESSTSGGCGLVVRKNGVGGLVFNRADYTQGHVHVDVVVKLVAGDYLEVQVFQDSGLAKGVPNTNTTPGNFARFAVTRVA